MKRIIALIVLIILCASAVFAASGSITVSPKQVPRGYFGTTLSIEFTPDAGTTWNSGKIYFVLPEAFYPAPTTVTATQGTLKAFTMTGGTMTGEIPWTQIQTDGYAVTINAVAISANSSIKVVYGYAENMGEGVQTPNVPGDYYILCGENPTGVAIGTSVPSYKVRVSDVAITKTADKSVLVYGDTVVYNITYSNINPIHQSQNVTVWDSVPLGLEIISTSMTPDSVTNNMLQWSNSMLSISSPVSISVTAKVKNYALSYGAAVTNTAEIKASDMYTNNYYEKGSVSGTVHGVSITSMIMTNPSSSVNQGQTITVMVRVSNNGNTTATYSTASVSCANTSATYIYGPVPSSAVIPPLGNAMFTWYYEATGTGITSFSANASASSGYEIVQAQTIASNAVYIFIPTNTPVINTPTEVPTFTPTHTYTAVDTATDVPTVPAATETPTVIPPTFTKTPVPVISATPTPTLQHTPAKTPDVPVYTNANVFNPAKGESITINYKLPYGTKVRVFIYNLSGEVVAELKDTEESGTQSATWDGKNEAKKTVGRGIYFVHIKQGDWQTIKKLIVIK